MSDAVIKRSCLKGELSAIPSKSFAHRILICAALADGQTTVKGIIPSEDIEATLGCLESLGALAIREGDKIAINPLKRAKNAVLDCNESGSTLRFMIAVAAALGGEYTFTGAGRLAERPNGVLISALEKGGVSVQGRGLPLKICGKLSGGEYEIDGGVSSQFVSGLLLASPLIGEDITIKIKGELKSKDYVNITLAVMEKFGVKAESASGKYFVRGGQRYRSAGEIEVEGDWSNAAFILAGGLLTGETAVVGLNPQSIQGDKAVLGAFEALGGRVKYEKGAYIAQKSPLFGAELNVENMIDAAPILAFLCAAARGKSVIRGVERLKLKESDRLAAIIDSVNSVGAAAYMDGDALVIEGNPDLRGGIIDGVNDHRIVMSAAILGAYSGVKIMGTEAVKKSYPAFFGDYKLIGGDFDVC